MPSWQFYVGMAPLIGLLGYWIASGVRQFGWIFVGKSLGWITLFAFVTLFSGYMIVQGLIHAQ